MHHEEKIAKAYAESVLYLIEMDKSDILQSRFSKGKDLEIKINDVKIEVKNDEGGYIITVHLDGYCFIYNQKIIKLKSVSVIKRDD